jgi:uncharacterized membrane protein
MDCWKKIQQEVPRPEAEGVFASLPSPMKFLLAGFSLIFIGVVIVMIATLIYGLPGSVGIIVFIGPIPIILGTGEYSFLAIVLAVVLTIISITFFTVLRKKKVNRILHRNTRDA